MNKKPYAYLDGIPDKTSDLYNDAGFINENEIDLKIYEWLDLDNAEDGQVLTVAVDGESVTPYWTDMPSGDHVPVGSIKFNPAIIPIEIDERGD